MHAFLTHARRAVALAAMLATAGCVDRTVAPRESAVRLSLTVGTAMIPNGSLDVDIFYRQDGSATVSLFKRSLQSDALGTLVPASFDSRCAASALAGQLANCTVQVPVQIDLAACLGDLRRRPEGIGCPVVVSLVLKDATGKLLGTATVGPISVIPGQPVVLPEVTLPLRG